MKKIAIKKNDKLYIFIDPFHSVTSGVSTYIKLAIEILNENHINTMVIKREAGESISSFKIRVGKDINTIPLSSVMMIEAPESLASGEFISSQYPRHIRLHCSKSLGAAIQNQDYDSESVKKEQHEIDRATIVSSPSWASYYASKSLFTLNERVLVFPNPCPKIMNSTLEPQFDVLFLGRYQKFKGVEYLNELTSRLPDVTFLIATEVCDKKLLKGKKNVYFCDGINSNKPDVYHSSNVVLVPSIFESSSMVLLEAFSYQRKIVAWEHLGAMEYQGVNNNKNIFPTAPFDLDALEENIKKALALINVKGSTFNDVNIIRQDFLVGVTAVIDDSSAFKYNVNPISQDSTSFICRLNKRKYSVMRYKSKNHLIRKTRKFFRNPRDFFLDSILFNKENTNHFVIFNDKEKLMKGKEQLASSHSGKIIEGKQSGTACNIIGDNQVNCTIVKNGRIEFPEPKIRVKGHAVAFLSAGDDPDSKSIKSFLDTYPDFSYVSSSSMYMGNFDIDETESPLSLINRIDLKNKNNFSLLDFIILLNAPLNLCKVLRSIGTTQRIILIDTKNLVLSSGYENYTDVVITLHDSDCIFRRRITCNDIESIALNIRRVLQEGFPKNPDMLLCVNPESAPFTRQDFIEFDYENFDGVIKKWTGSFTRFDNFNEYCDVIAKDVIGVALKESVFNRYRNILEIKDNNEKIRLLIKYALADGAIFDVKEV